MTTKTCDRCGAEIITFSWTPVTFPWFSIIRSDALDPLRTRQVDLCKRCQKDFVKWLSEKPEEEEDGNVDI